MYRVRDTIACRSSSVSELLNCRARSLFAQMMTRAQPCTLTTGWFFRLMEWSLLATRFLNTMSGLMLPCVRVTPSSAATTGHSSSPALKGLIISCMGVALLPHTDASAEMSMDFPVPGFPFKYIAQVGRSKTLTVASQSSSTSSFVPANASSHSAMCVSCWASTSTGMQHPRNSVPPLSRLNSALGCPMT